MPKIAVIEVDRTYNSDGDAFDILPPYLEFTEVQESDVDFIRHALEYHQHIVFHIPPTSIQFLIECGRAKKEAKEKEEARLAAERKAAAEKRRLRETERSKVTKAERLKKQLLAGKKAQEELERLGVIL